MAESQVFTFVFRYGLWCLLSRVWPLKDIEHGSRNLKVIVKEASLRGYSAALLSVVWFALGLANAVSQTTTGALHVGIGAGKYAHIADAETAIGPNKPGTVILEAGYTDTITSTLNIGVNRPYGIKLIMESGSRINEQITNGSPGIVILDGSSMQCAGSAPSGNINGEGFSTCMVSADGAFVSSMVTGNTALDNQYQSVFGLAGITFNAGSGTMNAVGDFAAMGPPSAIIFNSFIGGGNVKNVIYLHNEFGTVAWIANQVRGMTHGTLYYITGDEAAGYQGASGSFTIEGGEASCPGPNSPAIVIDGNPDNRVGYNWQGVLHVNFHQLWSQVCAGSDPPPPAYITIKDASYIHMYDEQFSSDAPTYISVSESNPGAVNNLLFDNITISCNQINCPGQVFIQDTTVTGYTHPAPTWSNNIALYGVEGYITHEQAGQWTNTPGPITNSVATTTIATGQGPLGSDSYQDASQGYALRVGDGGAINLDFGADGYLNSWIESYQNGTDLPKTLEINKKYHAPTEFGGDVGIDGAVSAGGALATGQGPWGSASYQDASQGYTLRVGNGGAINLDFGANAYVNSWIESYQNGTSLPKTLYINTKYHAPTMFGGPIGINGVGNSIDSSGNFYAGGGNIIVYRCTGASNNGILTVNSQICDKSFVDSGLRTK